MLFVCVCQFVCVSECQIFTARTVLFLLNNEDNFSNYLPCACFQQGVLCIPNFTAVCLYRTQCR